MTQDALAAKTGVSLATIGRLCRMQGSPSPANATLIARVLGASIRDIFPLAGIDECRERSKLAARVIELEAKNRSLRQRNDQLVSESNKKILGLERLLAWKGCTWAEVADELGCSVWIARQTEKEAAERGGQNGNRKRARKGPSDAA